MNTLGVNFVHSLLSMEGISLEEFDEYASAEVVGALPSLPCCSTGHLMILPRAKTSRGLRKFPVAAMALQRGALDVH